MTPSDKPDTPQQGKPTLDDVAFAVYVLALNYNGVCPYCKEKLVGDGKYKLWHYKQEHEA